MVLESVKASLNKTYLPHWAETVQKLKRNAALLKKHKQKAELEAESEESLNSMALLAAKRSMREDVAMNDDDFDQIAGNRTRLKAWLKTRRTPGDVASNVIGILRQGMKLASSLAGQNTTDFDNKNIQVASPRFMGLVRENVTNEVVSKMKLFCQHPLRFP